jgi:hypothetical protein
MELLAPIADLQKSCNAFFRIIWLQVASTLRKILISYTDCYDELYLLGYNAE